MFQPQSLPYVFESAANSQRGGSEDSALEFRPEAFTQDRTDIDRRSLQEAAAPAPFHPDEYLPGPDVRDDDEQGLVKAAGDIGTTIFHPVGTAKMGLASDPMMVVDDRLRVAGIDRLRVIDASVMPTITSGNTNAPTMMIAEKGAAMLREDAKALAKGLPS